MDNILDSVKSLFSSTPPLPKPAQSNEDLGQQAFEEAALERAKRARKHVLSQSTTPLPSPGRMDDINREATDVLQVPTYDGFRVEYHKPIVHTAEKSMTYSHLLWLGPSHLQGGSSYEFATQLQLGNVTLMSQLDTNGILNGRYHHQWTPQLLSKVQFAIAPAQKSQLNMTMGEVDYLGGDYSVNLKLSHDGIVVGSYLQSVTPTISTGVECLLQANELTAHSRFVGRYDSKVSGDNFTVSVLDQGTTQLSYARRVSPRLTLASEFKFDPNNRESTAKVGYKWSLRQSQFRGAIDSNGIVSAALDEAITPVMRFSVNGEIDHFQQQYKFGMGISVG